jgi:hypothetical protein
MDGNTRWQQWGIFHFMPCNYVSKGKFAIQKNVLHDTHGWMADKFNKKKSFFCSSSVEFKFVKQQTNILSFNTSQCRILFLIIRLEQFKETQDDRLNTFQSLISSIMMSHFIPIKRSTQARTSFKAKLKFHRFIRLINYLRDFFVAFGRLVKRSFS